MSWSLISFFSSKKKVEKSTAGRFAVKKREVSHSYFTEKGLGYYGLCGVVDKYYKRVVVFIVTTRGGDCMPEYSHQSSKVIEVSRGEYLANQQE